MPLAIEKAEFDLARRLGQKPILPLNPSDRASAMPILNRIKAFLVAAGLCAAFMAVDWATRFPYTFPDLRNYRAGFESGWYLSSVINLDWPRFIIAEGAWIYGFDALWRYIGSIESSFFVVSATATFLIILYIFLRTRSYVAILFILNPAFINLVIEQLRSGIASGLFYIGTLIKNPYLQFPFLFAALSIHTSFIFFVAFYYAFKLIGAFRVKKFLDGNFVYGVLALFAFAYMVSYFRDAALMTLEDSRAFIQEDQTSGIMLAVGWSLFLVSFFFLREKKEEYSFDYYFFALNVFMFISSIITGSYGARFVAIGIPALAVISQHVRPDRRLFFYLHYFLFSAVYFLLWVSL